MYPKKTKRARRKRSSIAVCSGLSCCSLSFFFSRSISTLHWLWMGQKKCISTLEYLKHQQCWQKRRKKKKKKGKRVLSKLSTFRKLFDIFAFVTFNFCTFTVNYIYRVLDFWKILIENFGKPSKAKIITFLGKLIQSFLLKNAVLTSAKNHFQWLLITLQVFAAATAAAMVLAITKESSSSTMCSWRDEEVV